MKPLTYHNFEIEIAPADGDGYPVAVLYSPSGQARTVLQLPFDDGALERQLAGQEETLTGSVDPDGMAMVRLFGGRLFDALFSGEVRRVYDMSRQAVADRGRGLRIKLRITEPALTAIPWEFLYDPRAGEFLALSRYTPVVRYTELPLPDPDLQVTPPLHVLGMAASPADAPPLDLGREINRLEEAVAGLKAKGRLELTWLEKATWRDLHAALQQAPWHVFHFIGHATWDDPTGQGVLLVADEYGDASPLGAHELGRLLADHPGMRLVLLNACGGAKGRQAGSFSSIASLLVERGLPAVLAMQYAFSEEAAVEFTRAFYAALAANLPLDAAVGEARKALSLALPTSPEWGTPVLFTRAPDGAIWEVEHGEDELNAEEKPYWWEDLPVTMGDFEAGDIGGDVIIASVGAGAQNVAIGKNITQLVYESLGVPAAGDRQAIEAELARVRAALLKQAGELGGGAAGMVENIFGQMEKELLKTGPQEEPDPAIITQMGDLLLNSLPHAAEPLTGLFATPAVGRVVGKAGKAAVKWVRERFSQP
jgi:hypothetical protein